MESILLIDKPAGVTSHDVVNMFRRRTGETCIGHAGTLDPMATGLLIILIGRTATKQQSTFLHLDKVYDCTAEIGVETDSYDRTGSVLHTAPWSEREKVTEKMLTDILKNFAGKIQQQVPAFSAVKVHGKELYKSAHKGKMHVHDLPIKSVEIYELSCTSFLKNEEKQSVHFSLHVRCSSGTYIRSLIHDIGKIVCTGATVTELRRTQIGEYTVADAEPISIATVYERMERHEAG